MERTQETLTLTVATFGARCKKDLFKEKEEITRKVGTEGLADQEAMASRISSSENQRQSQKLTPKGRKSHIAEKRPPQAGSFNPFHQSL